MSHDCFCDDEHPEWSRERRVKSTRREYECSECGAKLPPGSSVTRTDMKFEGAMIKHIMCADCQAFSSYALAHIPCLCWRYDQMFHDVLSALYDRALDEPESGAPELIRELREKRDAIKAAAKASRELPAGAREGEHA